MPLTDHEKQEFFEILSYLLPDDTVSLARTTIKDQVKILGVEDAVNAILTYTSDAKELFRRKKLKKEHLFKYLFNKGVDDINPSAEKNVLVMRILRYWGSEETFVLMEDDDSGVLACNDDNVSQPVLQQDIENLNCWADTSLMPNALDREFSHEFCRWFYIMLNNAPNSNNNSSGSSPGTFNSSHFFEDCTMKLLIKNFDKMSVDSFHGANEVSLKLLKLVGEDGVMFNPNLSEKGIQTLCDSFGRKVIIVAGTVHCREIIGLFEQHFGLVRDPASEFSWKIKFTRVAFRINDNPQHLQEPILEYTKHMLA